MSQDPKFITNPQELLKDPQQLNSYSYARNNPVKFVDPDGERVELAARPAVGERFLHMFFIVTPDSPGSVNVTGVPKGTEKFTIGAYPCPCGSPLGKFGIGNKLNPDTGYVGDPTENSDLPYLTGDKKVTDKVTISPAQGQSDTDLINSLGQAYDKIKAADKPGYFFGGQIGKFGYANSDNFVYELGSKVGIEDQVSGFNPKGLNSAPGQYRGYPNTQARQYIRERFNIFQQRINDL